MKKTLLPPLIPLVLFSLIAEFLVREGFVPERTWCRAPSAILGALIDGREVGSRLCSPRRKVRWRDLS